MLTQRQWARFGTHKAYVVPTFSNRKKDDDVHNIPSNIMVESSRERRPLLRGWVHFVASTTLMVTIASTTREMNGNVLAFLFGKCCCMTASAHLHMLGFRSMTQYSIANSIDWALIVTSAWADAFPAASMYGSFARCILTYGFLPLIVAVGYTTWMAEHLGSRKYRQLAKSLVVAAFGLAGGAQAFKLSVDALYLVRILLVFLGAMSWQTKGQKSACVQKMLFWHNADVWSGHEDFHALILIADVLMFVIYYQHGGVFDCEWTKSRMPQFL